MRHLAVLRDGEAEKLLLAAKQEGHLTAQYEHVRTPYMILDGFKPDGDVVQFARSAKLQSKLRRAGAS